MGRLALADAQPPAHAGAVVRVPSRRAGAARPARSGGPVPLRHHALLRVAHPARRSGRPDPPDEPAACPGAVGPAVPARRPARGRRRHAGAGAGAPLRGPRAAGGDLDVRHVLPALHAQAHRRRPRRRHLRGASAAGGGLPGPAPGDRRRDHLRRRPAHAAHGRPRADRAGGAAGAERGDHPHRHARAGDAADAHHRGTRAHAAPLPPALDQHALQPPARADAGVRRGLRPAGRRRHPARQPDGAAARRERPPARHRAALPRPRAAARAAVLPVPVRPGARGGAFPHAAVPRHRDHGVPARPAERPGHPHVLRRCAARRRQDPAAAQLRRLGQPDAHRAAQLRGADGGLPGAGRAPGGGWAGARRRRAVGVWDLARGRASAIAPTGTVRLGRRARGGGPCASG